MIKVTFNEGLFPKIRYSNSILDNAIIINILSHIDFSYKKQK